jgi:hypothetical protein
MEGIPHGTLNIYDVSKEKKMFSPVGSTEGTFLASSAPRHSGGHSSIINRKYDSIAKSGRNSHKKGEKRLEPADPGKWNLSSKGRSYIGFGKSPRNQFV